MTDQIRTPEDIKAEILTRMQEVRDEIASIPEIYDEEASPVAVAVKLAQSVTHAFGKHSMVEGSEDYLLENPAYAAFCSVAKDWENILQMFSNEDGAVEETPDSTERPLLVQLRDILKEHTNPNPDYQAVVLFLNEEIERILGGES